MNINIYLEDELGIEIGKTAEKLGKSRNAVIREAIKEWLQHHEKQTWPESILAFKGDPNFPKFESYRDELDETDEDPFA